MFRCTLLCRFCLVVPRIRTGFTQLYHLPVYLLHALVFANMALVTVIVLRQISDYRAGWNFILSDIGILDTIPQKQGIILHCLDINGIKSKTAVLYVYLETFPMMFLQEADKTPKIILITLQYSYSVHSMPTPS